MGKKLTWDDVERIEFAAVQEADRYTSSFSAKRQEAWDRYYARDLGNERPGRSQYHAHDVMDTVEWAIPHIMTRVASKERRVKLRFAGTPDWVGDAIQKKIKEDQDKSETNFFKLLYQLTKDGLVSGISGLKPRWIYEEGVQTEDVQGPVPLEQAMALQNQGLRLGGKPRMTTDGMGRRYLERFKVSRTVVKEDRFGADNIPHWEILIQRASRGANDRWGKGTQTTVTLGYLRDLQANWSEDGEPFFKNLDKVADRAGRAALGTQQSTEFSREGERQSYESDDAFSYDSSVTGGGMDAADPRTEVKLTEWFDELDVDGDGHLEPITCWFGDGTLIRWEVNKEEFVPMAFFSPIIDCFKSHGIGWAELLIPIQNLKTMVTRTTLDQFGFVTNGRWRVSPGAQGLDMQSLIDGDDVVRAEEGDLEDITPRQMDMTAPISLLSMADQLKEERGGVTNVQQGRMTGQTSQAFQGSAMPDRGIARLMQAGRSRLDLVARILAETCLKDFYKKAAWLFQKYLEQPFSIELHGEQLTISPEMIRGKEVLVEIELPLEDALGQQEAQKIQMNTQYLIGLNQVYPGLFPPQNAHKAAARHTEALGFSATDWVPPLQQFVQAGQQQAQAAQQEQQLQVQMMMQQLKLEQMDRQIKLRELGQDADEARKKLLQDERDSLRDYEVELRKLNKENRVEELWARVERVKQAMEDMRNVRELRFQEQQAEANRRAQAQSAANGPGGPAGRAGAGQPSFQEVPGTERKEVAQRAYDR